MIKTQKNSELDDKSLHNCVIGVDSQLTLNEIHLTLNSQMIQLIDFIEKFKIYQNFCKLHFDNL